MSTLFVGIGIAAFPKWFIGVGIALLLIILWFSIVNIFEIGVPEKKKSKYKNSLKNLDLTKKGGNDEKR